MPWLELRAKDIPAIGVQHHHAHIAACMAENGLKADKVIGVSFDGTGYGDDGAIWGGNSCWLILTASQRAAHLAYIPLAGGDRAVREPWRVALAWLQTAGIEWEQDLPPVKYALARQDHGIPALEALSRQLQTKINAPLTSSMGRLFDAAAALIGIRQSVNYEAQAAIEMEAIADGARTRLLSFRSRRGVYRSYTAVPAARLRPAPGGGESSARSSLPQQRCRDGPRSLYGPAADARFKSGRSERGRLAKCFPADPDSRAAPGSGF